MFVPSLIHRNCLQLWSNKQIILLLISTCNCCVMDGWLLFWCLFSRTNKKTRSLMNYKTTSALLWFPLEGWLRQCRNVCLALHPSRRAATNEALDTAGAPGPPGKPADSRGAPWTAGHAPASRTGARRCRNIYTAWHFHPRDFNDETHFAKSAATSKTPILNSKIVSH